MTSRQEPTRPQQPQQPGQSAREHAAWIAGRVQTLLKHYYQPETPEDVETQALADWISVLRGYRQQDISEACELYLRDQPRVRPTPGSIVAKLRGITARRRELAPSRQLPPPPEPNRITPEAAQAIVDRAGYSPKRPRRSAPVECSVPFLSTHEAARLVHDGKMTAEQAAKWTLHPKGGAA